MKGIILAGGSGTRLYPSTTVISKQLLPIFDKPMVYYPLSTLMLSGIRDILIISTPEDTPLFEKLFGDGKKLGLNLSYEIQPSPDGLAQAFIIGEKFIQNDDVALILGDNIFYGHGLTRILQSSVDRLKKNKTATVFGYSVKRPKQYGVISFNNDNKVIDIQEKPKFPKSNYAVTGLYFYPNDVVKVAKQVKPSDRGELEITSVNQEYLKKNRLTVELMGRGYVWLDTGTIEAMYEASRYIQVIESRQGLKVACIEEIAYKMGYINKSQLYEISLEYKNEYGDYLKSLLA